MLTSERQLEGRTGWIWRHEEGAPVRPCSQAANPALKAPKLEGPQGHHHFRESTARQSKGKRSRWGWSHPLTNSQTLWNDRPTESPSSVRTAETHKEILVLPLPSPNWKLCLCIYTQFYSKILVHTSYSLRASKSIAHFKAVSSSPKKCLCSVGSPHYMLPGLKQVHLGYNPRAKITKDPPVSRQMSVGLALILYFWIEFSKNKCWSGSSPVFCRVSSLAPLPGKYSYFENIIFLNDFIGDHKFHTPLANIKHSNSLIGTGFVQAIW